MAVVESADGLMFVPIIKGVVIWVVKVGEVPNTKAPVPVSSVREADRSAETPVLARLLETSVKTALLAVRPESVIVPDELMPVAPVTAPAPLMSREAVSRIFETGAVPSMTMAEVRAPAVLEIRKALVRVLAAALFSIKRALVVVSGVLRLVM